MRHAIVFIYTFARYRSSSFGSRRLSKLKVHDAIPSFRIYYPMRIRSLGIVQIYDITFVLTTPSIGNIVRIKMPLIYEMRIFANGCNCTSVVISLSIFNISSMFFFSTRDILSTLERSKINAAAFHGAIMMLQFFQLTLRRFVIAYCNFRRATDQPENAEQR